MNLYTLDEPKKWRAGYVGSEREPFYFDCGGCDKRDAVIHSFISEDGTYKKMAIFPVGALYRQAMFCQECTEVVQTTGKIPRPPAVRPRERPFAEVMHWSGELAA